MTSRTRSGLSWAAFHIPALLLSLVLLLTAQDRASGAGKEKGALPYLTVREIMQRMEASNISYSIASSAALKEIPPERYADFLWPLGILREETPWIETDSRGERKVVPFPFDSKALSHLMTGEPLFQAQRYPEALTIYAEAAQLSPRCYLAFSHVGDCYFATHQYERALESYDKAIEINPHDFRTFFYRGDALTKLGRYGEAREAYIQALALNPRHDNTLHAVRAQSEKLRVNLHDDPFAPQALARQEKGGIAIYLNLKEENPHWLAYGSCKALWLGEPAHRKEMLGTTDHGWSNIEERECLAALLTVYLDQRESGKLRQDPALERIGKILKEGFIDQFILYEMGSRVDPNIMVRLGPAAQDKMRQYISRHVVAPAEKTTQP